VVRAASAVVEMVDAVLRDKKKILRAPPTSRASTALRDVYLGVPVKLGAKGVEQIVEIELMPEESAALEKSANAVRELFRILKV
jgi:malate dehydrogenase